MDFGKVRNLDIINFALPPDHPATSKILAATPSSGYLKPKIYIGSTTWANKDWLGSYFPAGISQKDYLPWYSKQFNTIELNLTHYYTPDAETVQRWREAVTPNFVFCPKLPKLISHEMQLHETEVKTQAFCAAIAGLEEYLGTNFLQLPPAFGPHFIDTLIYYLEAFPKNIPLALELRNPDWFKDNTASDMIFETMQALNISSVITDVAGRRDVLHQRLTTPTAFIRFNGYGLHPSDYTRIDEWVARISTWLNNGLQTLYFFMHQENSLHVPELANYFTEQLNSACGLQIETCKPVSQPVQGKLF